MSLDFRWLRAFTMVAHEGSFVAAAQRLHLSQPALGQQVRKLEEQLDAVLLERHARGVRLTPAGTLFLPHAEAILDHVAAAEQLLRRRVSTRCRKLVLGATPAAARAFGPHIMAACAGELDLELAIRSVLTAPALEQFADSKLDLALCYLPAPRAARVVPLYQEAFCLVGPAALLAEGQTTVPFRQLAGVRLILDPTNRILVEELCRPDNIALDVVAEIEPGGITPDLLEQSGCCSILSRALFADEIAAGRLRCARIVDPSLNRTVYFNARADVPVHDVELVLGAVAARASAEIASGARGWMPPSPG
ncbi:LysR family transcriptional regulator, nitrogen assimilation regulatory protein [Sphingomonas guangdongensis]|uniref:LysR family transcriptional regulator, nitrogen assimilation regulatory protein n=1 Tax=Sphingomonas guangdongensis TaxID=1141890 RepID=A0A285R4N8_9SPHN|nr:LysR family transcriptional regulator [Sphingomonas guangdongensis]SOB87312.1 LysR family transcriptional regulator, nitrogen assimilation regulatory protein [Sphingomonas guangdongensis]